MFDQGFVTTKLSGKPGLVIVVGFWEDFMGQGAQHGKRATFNSYAISTPIS